jgi:hypothetical protein
MIGRTVFYLSEDGMSRKPPKCYLNFNIGHFIAEKVPLGLLERSASTPHGVETAAPQECFANGGMMPPRLLAAGDPGECGSRGAVAGRGVYGLMKHIKLAVSRSSGRIHLIVSINALGVSAPLGFILGILHPFR